MRIVSWNIRAGGGKRWLQIVSQLRAWQPDVIVLCEFRFTQPSRSIAQALRASGWCYQRNTALPDQPAVNAVLIATRHPLRKVSLRRAPKDPTRWLHVNLSEPRPLSIAGVHVPNRVTGRKYAFLDAMTEVARKWRGPPGLFVGDTNSGRIELDEENSAFNQIEDRWMVGMEKLGWFDAFRALNPTRREFTWYSPNAKNGFRLDQAFVNRRLIESVTSVSHHWGGTGGISSEAVSDHAALIIDIRDT